MTKKKIMIFCALCLSILLMGGTAMAVPYSLLFDADAAGTAKIQERIWGWDLETVGKKSVPIPNQTTIFGTGTGYTIDLVTQQQLGADNILNNGDLFYEDFTVDVINGLDAPPGYGALIAGMPGGSGYYNFPEANLLIDTSLNGFITNYSAGSDGVTTKATNPTAILDDSFYSIFTGGSATMYVDGSGGCAFDDTYNVGETVVSTFAFDSAGPFVLVPSVFQPGGAAAVTLGFEFTLANPAYFATAPGESDLLGLINSGWLLSFEQGGVAGIGGEIGGLINPAPDEILIGFQETGFDARFEVIPEPATMLLLGSGLLGLAGLGRKKIFRKD